ncbi:iron-regulated protein A [Vibrio sp. JPW-9-11-11]|uniref:imelysin family protein n=1 Tax=Vibrio sp. JPW-9-11-11 TaxID=1416532 RepID=UPI0015932C64|nr:imelysin family protein [Vibrio sp. JPW-9-11-11]NVD06823.1 iron-regulated protein A [Vibrio sp. JPW-9-11-11]
MKTKRISTGALLTLALFGCQTSSDERLVFENTNHISQKVYEVETEFAGLLNTQATSLSQVMSKYCQRSVDVDTVKQQWRKTMQSWMALQGQERGPQAALAQSWNMQFWPDKKNTTGRKMQRLIATEQSWTQAQIAAQSVTVQGLGAVEWLLYDNKSDLATSATTCQTAMAISDNIQHNAALILQAWQLNPWTQLDAKQWQSEYIALLSNQLEYSMKKMSRPLANFGHPRPYFSESWRSQTSMQNLYANLVSMQTLYLARGAGLDAMLRDMDKAALADRIVNQFAMAIETWPRDKSLFELLQTKQGYQYAYAQYNKLEQLKYLIHEEVAIELGVVIGFNATDGD